MLIILYHIFQYVQVLTCRPTSRTLIYASCSTDDQASCSLAPKLSEIRPGIRSRLYQRRLFAIKYLLECESSLTILIRFALFCARPRSKSHHKVVQTFSDFKVFCQSEVGFAMFIVMFIRLHRFQLLQELQ